MGDNNNGFQKFVQTFTGGEDGWGISTTGLVVFLIVLMISVVMLIVNGVYFIKVYDSSNDEDLNNYWSRGGALTLAIFNFLFAALLFIEFIIILRIILTRNSLNDPTCLRAIGGNVDPISGLPKPDNPLDRALKQANLAYTTANPSKTGYVEGVSSSGALDSGLYINGKYLVPGNDVNEGESFRGRNGPITGFNTYKTNVDAVNIDDLSGYAKTLAQYKKEQYANYDKPINTNLYINPFPESAPPFNEIFKKRRV
jgi:hypothetical protein